MFVVVCNPPDSSTAERKIYGPYEKMSEAKKKLDEVIESADKASECYIDEILR